MITHLYELLIILEKINKNAFKKVLKDTELIKERKKLANFKYIELELNDLISELNNSNFKDHKQMRTKLLYFHSHILDYFERVESLYKLATKLVSQYEIPQDL